MTADEGASLESVLATAELACRPAREADRAAEIAALVRLADELAQPSRHALQEVAATALQLCRAQSAGVALVEVVEGKARSRWQAVAGDLDEYLWSALPQDRSLAGIVLDLGGPQLFRYPERHLRHLAERRPQIVEALIVPMYDKAGVAIGALWAVIHQRDQQFDGEDLRLLGNLAHFAVAAHRSHAAIEQERSTIRQREASLGALNRELRDSLAAISNAVEFLAGESANAPEQQKAREMIRRQLDQIGMLGEQLVDSPIGTHLVERKPAPLVAANRPPRKLKRERVLIIDDSVDSGDSLGMLLRSWGHDVRTAQGAVAGLQLEWEFEPHAIVLDIEMPGKNGYEVASELRVRRRRDLLLVALSGHVREEDRARSLAAGFDHHMTKPADLGLLERILS